jgi:hypothetical protein
MPSDKEQTMHPRIRERAEGLQALRARATLATTEFFAMIGKDAPINTVRYQVHQKGEHAYHIVELATGKVRGFRFTYKEAVNFAQQQEARAQSKAALVAGGLQ